MPRLLIMIAPAPGRAASERQAVATGMLDELLSLDGALRTLRH